MLPILALLGVTRRHRLQQVRSITRGSHAQQLGSNTILESGAFNVLIRAAIGPVQWVVPAVLACAALAFRRAMGDSAQCLLHAGAVTLSQQLVTSRPQATLRLH
jgi:hypothetical protein